MVPGTRDERTLVGRCTSCGQVKNARALNLVYTVNGCGTAGRTWKGDGNFALLCGPCFVDGFDREAVAS